MGTQFMDIDLHHWTENQLTTCPYDTPGKYPSHFAAEKLIFACDNAWLIAFVCLEKLVG